MSGCFADIDRIKAGRLQEDGGGLFSNTRSNASKNAGNTHALFCIGNYQVGTSQFPLLLIQGNKGSPLGHGSDNHLLTLDLIRIKSV